MKQNSGKHARFMLEKRQRVPATAADDEDEEVSTIPVATTSVRGGRQPLPTVDPDDEETATAATTTRGRVPLTTSESSASLSLGRGGGRTTAETTTSTAAAPSLVFTPSSTSSSTSSTTPRTTSRTSTSSTSARPTTSSASLSSTTTSSAPTSATSGITNNADTANQTNKDEGGSNTGAIAGAVIGVLVLLAIAAFFGLRYRKKKQRQAEDAAIFSHGGNNPGGAAGLGASAFGKRQSAGYNQHVDSNEDLPSGGNNGNGYGYGEKDFANVGEKQHSSGMAGYGTLALNSAANGGNNNNFNGFSSPSHAALLGRDATGNFSPVQPGAFVAPAFPPGHHDSQDRFSNFSNGYPHSVTAGDGVAEYPPPVAGIQQNPHASMQSFASNPNRRSMGPSAAMMAHPQDSFNAGSSQLPPHQDHALASALNRSSGSAYPAGAIVAAAAAQNVPLPLSPATATRQSINSVATAAAAAALGNQPTEDSVDGPFGDPSHEGKIYIVTRVFEPSMPDELVFYPGDRIQVVVTYDDGWCLGCNLDSPQRDGKPPARGVFPRDCVEELTPETEAAFASRPASQATVMGNQTPVNFDEDRPMASGGANLQRAPTLPPLDMGNSSRFSMGSAAAARQSEEQARQSKRFSTAPNAGKRQSRAIAESDADDEMDDAYGGVAAATSATPTRTAFPPEIQVSSSASPPTGMDARRASHQFGSTQHIADYASQLEQQQQQQQQAARRLSTLDEESNSHMTDEFPSTPRTAHPDSPQVSHLAGGNRSSIAASPAGSAARLSIAGLPKSSSASSIKRTSSLIASKDADLFLAFGDLGKDGRQQ